MAATPPASALGAFALLAGLVAWLSASQDVVVDAYRTDLLPAAERGFGSSLTVLGYRLAMILSGGIAFIWVDPRQGGGWSWPEVYRAMALFMVGAAVFSALLAPRLLGAAPAGERRPPRRAGFLAVVVAVAVGFVVDAIRAFAAARALVAPALCRHGASPRRCPSAGPIWSPSSSASPSRCRWRPGRRARARFETLLGSLPSYFGQPGAARSSPSSSSTSWATLSPARC